MMIRINPACEKHSDLVCAIIRESFKEQAERLGINNDEYPNFVAFDTPEKVRERMRKGDRTVIAYVGGEPVGTVSCNAFHGQAGRGCIRRLAVLPRHRGKNYGQALMEHAEKYLAANGVSSIELAIVARFHGLERYYLKMGYVSLERKSFPSLPFEVLYMEKTTAL